MLAAPPPGVQARNGWFRFLLPNLPAGGYVTLNDTGAAPAVLLGARSSACGSIMLHRTETAGGVERMVAVPSVTVPARGSFRFSPGGYHLMCMQPAMHPGETVSVTLSFAGGANVIVPFAVRGPGVAPAANSSMNMPMTMPMK
ncbi:MAG: copper chaperone PCu(A)C [Acetobacteraceae bacterium]